LAGSLLLSISVWNARQLPVSPPMAKLLSEVPPGSAPPATPDSPGEHGSNGKLDAQRDSDALARLARGARLKSKQGLGSPQHHQNGHGHGNGNGVAAAADAAASGSPSALPAQPGSAAPLSRAASDSDSTPLLAASLTRSVSADLDRA
jgi:hypothetical protein